MLAVRTDRHDPTRHLAGNDFAFGIDHQAVGPVGLLAEDRQLAVRIDLVNSLIGDVAEVDIAIAVRGRSLGEFEPGVQFGDFGRRADAGDRFGLVVGRLCEANESHCQGQPGRGQQAKGQVA